MLCYVSNTNICSVTVGKMIEDIKETIKVKAIFAAGGVKPEAFAWRGRVYAVKEIHGVHAGRLGRAKRLHYAVSCNGEDVFEITLDTENMEWRLDRIHTPG